MYKKIKIKKLHPDGISLPKDSKQCPLCLNPSTNPSSLPTGYVFCYPCIYKYVREYHRCPLTFVAMNESDVRKVYLGNS